MYNGVNGNLDANNLATSAVTTAKIADSNVTTAKLASASVTPDKLATGAAAATVTTSETTPSTSYTNLATTTDSVTVTIGANGVALVSLLANMADSLANAFTWVSVDVSGTNTIAASDANAIMFQNSGAGVAMQIGGTLPFTGLAAGSTTFKMKYKVQNGGGGSGTGTFSNRKISVIPL